MSTPILATKLYIPPPRPNVVPRPRLIERLNEGLRLGRKLTLLSAPAGFGKTTLLSEWLATGARPAAWLWLDEGDNDLTRFLTYLVAALRTLAQSGAERIAANIGEEVLEVLHGPPPVPTEPILTALLNDMAAVPDDFILVLDDYHVIDAEPVDDTLTFLLERLPPQIHLVIATRENPDIPLARLRARGQLTELRVADLRFIPAEAAAFLNQVMGLNLSAEDIATLETRTEGWIAGLQLAALSMRGQKDATRFIESFTGSHHFVLDYLVEEVLEQQPESVQTFLLRTSILDRLCGSLCDAVVGRLETGDWGLEGDDQAAGNLQFATQNVQGQETLEYLERANLLVVPLDHKRQWYRYHHLFADVLQAHLLKEHPDQVASLHRRACQWYEQNDLRSDAIRHALAAQDFQRAADLIELEWSVVRRSCFRSPTWLGWVKALPGELVRTRPVLSVGYAMELLNFGELEAAEAQMRDAERWLEPNADINEPPEEEPIEPVLDGMVVVNEDEFPSLRGMLATVRAFHAQALGDLPGTVKHARRALALASESDYYTRGIASLALGFASWTSGDLKTAPQFISGGMASLQKAGNFLFALWGTIALADIWRGQGRLHKAARTYEQALQLAADQPELVLQGAASLYLGLSELHLEQGDLATARQHLLKSEALGEQTGLPDWQYRRCLTQARIKQTQGDLDGALDLLDEAERLYFNVSFPEVRPVGALKARLWLGQGRLKETLDWVRERGLSVDDELSYLREFEHVTLARLLLAQYRNDRVNRSIHAAMGLLERLLRAAEAGERSGSVIEIHLLQALAHQAQGDRPAALLALQQALRLAEPEGYVRLFVDEGRPVAQLLSAAATQGMMPDYVNKLLAAFEEATKDEGRRTKEDIPSSVVGPSSPALSTAEGLIDRHPLLWTLS